MEVWQLALGLIGTGFVMVGFVWRGINELVNFRLLVERLIAELTTEQHTMKQHITEIRGDVGDLKSRVGQHDVQFAEIGHARGIRQKPA